MVSLSCTHFDEELVLPQNTKRNLKNRCWSFRKVKLSEDKHESFYAQHERSGKENNEFVQNELRILKQVRSHQNVVKFISACTCDTTIDKTAIFMELCDGNLEEFIKNKHIKPLTHLASGESISEIKAQTYFKHYNTEIDMDFDLLHQTVCGLEYLHANNIIHCNLKPSNILLIHIEHHKTVAKLGGFEFSQKQQDDLSAVGDKSEISSRSKAFECWDNKWSKSSDVFELGVLMYYTFSKGNHPFEQNKTPRTRDQLVLNEEQVIINNIKRKQPANFLKLRERQTSLKAGNKEKWITAIDMIKRMICHNLDKRLTIEQVLHHPTFYTPQKKLDFLLKIHEVVKENPEAFNRNVKFNEFDKGLMNDKESGQKVAFSIRAKQVFRQHRYFLYGGDVTKLNKNPFTNQPYWQFLNNVSTVPSLLEGLRNKVAHACDNPPGDVPVQFYNDFRLSKDSYNPAKFLEVFLSTTPQLLVHLYEQYRDFSRKNNCLDRFYPR